MNWESLRSLSNLIFCLLNSPKQATVRCFLCLKYLTIFIVNFCRHCFLQFLKKGPRPKWTIINTFQTNLKTVCLSVILEFCLPSVVCGRLSAYPNLCRGQKNLLKVRYIILKVTNMAGFLISNTFFCCRMEILPYILKIITQTWTAFVFGKT